MSAATPSLAEATRVWAQIGLLSFGGPAGQIALMHRLLVEEKRWISDTRFLHALNFCMLLPGPEAQQLVTYVGWMLHRLRGGLIAGLLFILPGALVIFGLSCLYALAGHLPLVQGMFTGLKPVVLVIVVQALLRIGKRALTTVPLRLLALLAFLAMWLLQAPFPLVIALAAACGLLLAQRPAAADEAVGDVPDPTPRGGFAHAVRCLLTGGLLWLVPTALLFWVLGGDHVFTQIAGFFSKMAVVTFGGAYAVLGYVSQEAVQHYGWLQPGEMLDGLGMAETTPGPLILVVQFVGFMAAFRDPGALHPLLAGLLGSGLTLWVTFVPCFLWIFLGAPYMETLRQNRRLGAALAGVTTAVVGVIAHLALWFGSHVLFATHRTLAFGITQVELPIARSVSVPSLLFAALAALLLLRLKWSIPLTLLLVGALGILWRCLVPI